MKGQATATPAAARRPRPAPTSRRHSARTRRSTKRLRCFGEEVADGQLVGALGLAGSALVAFGSALIGRDCGVGLAGGGGGSRLAIARIDRVVVADTEVAGDVDARRAGPAVVAAGAQCLADGVEAFEDGPLEGCSIECPHHGALFDVTTGEAAQLPGVSPIETFPVQVKDGAISIEFDE